MPQLTTSQIAQAVAGELDGPGDLTIRGVERLDSAGPDQISFIANTAYVRLWAAASAPAALVSRHLELTPGQGRALIRVADADLAVAQVLEFFAPPLPTLAPGIHPSAVVDPSARIAAEACVGPLCVVGPRASVGARSVLHAQVTLLDDSQLGEDCRVWPGVVIRERCQLGDRCILHANVTIGSDGFGYRPSCGQPRSRPVKIPHIGTVHIGHDVEVGAGTCIDRGKFSATVIGDDTKIDNLCQIAHNCRIGRGCVIAGQVGLAGSVTLGDGVVLGGKVAIKDHVTIGSGARLAACSAVMDDVPPNGVWGGYPARESHTALREHAALRKLPALLKQLRDRLPPNGGPSPAERPDVSQRT